MNGVPQYAVIKTFLLDHTRC